MKPIQIISQDLFDKVRSRFTNLEMGDETGAVTIDPAEARFFDFDFVNEGVNLGRVSISLNDLGSLKIYYSQGITENQDDQATQMWFNFLKEMRLFSMRRLLRFDTRDIAKTNLDKNDFQHLAATQGPKEEPDMNTMNETKRGLQEGRDVIATGTPDAIKLKIKELGLGTARRESIGSGGEAIFVFNNPNYYVSQGQDGNWELVQTNAESDQQGVAEDDDAVAAFLARGGKIQQLKPQRDPTRSGVSFASKHIGSGSGRGTTKGQVSGLGANTGKSGKPVVTAEQGVAEGEHTMNESRWNHKSSSKTSRAVQGKTEVIVRHAKAVEETYPGARSQNKNIKAIFIQNADGERAKYPFIHLAGAFAMAQHVDHGGVPHDPAGKAIIKMSEHIAKLGEFQRHIQLSSINADAHRIAERAIGHMNELKAKVAALGKRHHYEAWKEDFEMASQGGAPEEMVLDAVTLEDYKNKFTQTNFQEELVGFFPLLHRIMGEANTVDLEEYVSGQDIEEATALDKYKDNRFAPQNEPVKDRPMPQQSEGAAPWEDDVKKLATINPVDRYSAYANIRSYFKDNPELSQMASDLMGGYYEAKMLSGKYKTDAAKAKYAELELMNQEFIKQALGQEQGDEEPPFEPDNKSYNTTGSDGAEHGGHSRARHLARQAIPKEKSAAQSIDTFEEWAESVEKGHLTPEQIQELKSAIETLPQGPAGPELDFDTAYNFFNQYGINSDELQQAFSKEQQRATEIQATPLQVFQAWATETYPELLMALGMSDTGAEEPAPAAPPAPEAGAAPAPEQPVAEGKSSMVQEVAKIVKSFYNQSNESVGPFRAPENIALDCKKQVTEKFGEKAGEQAYEMAEAFINKLTQEWHQKHGRIKSNPVDHGDGLSVDGLKEILGRIKQKVEGIGQPEMEDSKKDFRTHGMDSQPSEKNPDGNPPPTDWKTDPIAAATDRAHDAGSKLLQRLAGIRKK